MQSTPAFVCSQHDDRPSDTAAGPMSYAGQTEPKSSRGWGQGRGRGRGRGRGGGSGFEREQETHADRAARLFELARASSLSSSQSSPSSVASSSKISASNAPRTLGKPGKVASAPPAETADLSAEPIPLPLILKSLANPALGTVAFTIKEAIPIAGKLVRAKLNNQISLAHLNGPVLEDAGITSEMERHKILTAFGVRALKASATATHDAASEISGSSRKTASPALSKEAAKAKRALEELVGKSSSAKRRRQMDDEQLSREYGNVTMPTSEADAGLQPEYLFNEVLDVGALRGRFVYVNRAPIMTAWTTIVLERLGFQRREALSLAHCYVHTTSTSRGISLGIIPASERNRAVNFVGASQPHFELMGVKIPLMKLSQIDEWRGISQGQVIGPDQAFNYIRKSMHQTLPLVIGALALLADSFVNPTQDDVLAVKREDTASYLPPSQQGRADVPSPDLLHARSYELYTIFRPATAGEWGKKSMFYCDKALALRRGYEEDWAAWQASHGEDDEDLARGSNDNVKSEIRTHGRNAAQTAEQQVAEAREFEEELQRLVENGAEEHSRLEETSEDEKKPVLPSLDADGTSRLPDGVAAPSQSASVAKTEDI